MGFPAAYSDLQLPEFVLHVVLLLGYVRRLVCWGFDAVGLGELIDSEAPWPDSAPLFGVRRQEPRFWPPSALLIHGALPAVRYEEEKCVGGGCAVFLFEFEAAEEVRRVEHEQSTCPLCRTPLLPDEMRRALDGSMFAAAASAQDSSYYDDHDGDFYSSPRRLAALRSSPPPSNFPSSLTTNSTLRSSIPFSLGS